MWQSPRDHSVAGDRTAGSHAGEGLQILLSTRLKQNEMHFTFSFDILSRTALLI